MFLKMNNKGRMIFTYTELRGSIHLTLFLKKNLELDYHLHKILPQSLWNLDPVPFGVGWCHGDYTRNHNIPADKSSPF